MFPQTKIFPFLPPHPPVPTKPHQGVSDKSPHTSLLSTFLVNYLARSLQSGSSPLAGAEGGRILYEPASSLTPVGTRSEILSAFFTHPSLISFGWCFLPSLPLGKPPKTPSFGFTHSNKLCRIHQDRDQEDSKS